MISSLCFIPRGAAKAEPEQQELSSEEMDALIQKQAGMSLEQLEAVEAEAEADAAATPTTVGASKPKKSGGMSDSDADDDDAEMKDDNGESDEKKEAPMDDKEAQLLKELSMDGYDDEPEGAELMLGGHKLVVHENNADDPYVTVPDHDDYDEEDDEDLIVKQTDVVICVGKTEEEASTLEVYLYEEEGGKLYVHHDFNLPSFPLSLCWMDCDPRTESQQPTASSSSSSAPTFTASTEAAKGSFLAVGTFHTGIEIWNLDVLDVLEPVCTLGGREEPDMEVVRAISLEQEKKKGKKGKKAVLTAAQTAKLQGELRPGSHSDAVMCLAWHPAARTRLASGSADHSVKLWDVCTQQCHSTLALHSNKVQSIQWNYAESNILLSGSYDQTICMTDIRANTAKKEGVHTFSVRADIEQVKWSPHQPTLFGAALENGEVVFFDARSPTKTSFFTLSAHSAPCTNLTFNSVLPSCFATSSIDKTVKIWDYSPTPSLVSSKDFKPCGSIFTAAFDANYPHLIAVGGDKGKLGIWDIREDAKCRAKYGDECDGNMGKKQQPTQQQQNPFAMGGATLTAASSSSSASSSAAAPKKKKKEKKEMKTSMRRKRPEEDSD